MASDITSLFKASVKTVRTRNKGLVGGKEAGNSSILSHARNKTEFATRARDVANNISKLKDFLLQHRKDYINAASHLISDTSGMTDAERDQIDTDAQQFMRTCSETIRMFKEEVLKQTVSAQVRSHREAVFELLQDYLKAVCKLYSEQRAVRVKRVVEKKRISRLQPNQPALANSLHPPATSTPAKPTQDPGSPDLELTNQEGEEEEFSPEEVQMFEQENKRLFNEMNCLVDEVRQIEGKVVEITKLQEIFTDKVLQQEADIDRIADTVVATTENIKEGNEDIREAIKNNAGFRVWILFFLVMCSFSLLFLDWYS
ncbi:syntaxin-18-like [Acanthaster planci]|uniref:Syntaxin-18 n=1 Tax=Acanthaster planci TaxID=133434 RepID=A0A8B7XIE3_ACAPL|nr:syntaxin-18-like [Acanthaster planci]